MDRLQRVLRRDQPPHRIEPQAVERQPADEDMALVGRIERAAEQADRAAGGVFEQGEVFAQGRV